MARLLPNLKHYFRPADWEDFYRLRREHAASSVLLAGGTGLVFSRPGVDTVIDLGQLPMKGIHAIDGADIEIGALTTIHDLERDPAIKAFCGGILVHACRHLASTPLRNLITVGGNFLGGFPWSDLPVALLVLDAKVRIDHEKKILEKEMDTGLKHPGRSVLSDGDVLTKILLPGARKHARGAFIKFSRTAVDLSLVTVAVSYFLNDNRISVARVATGGIVPNPVRIPDAEQVLEGAAPGDDVFLQAGFRAAESVKPRPDVRAGEEYRRDLLKTLVFRTCSMAAGGVP